MYLGDRQTTSVLLRDAEEVEGRLGGDDRNLFLKDSCFRYIGKGMQFYAQFWNLHMINTNCKPFFNGSHTARDSEQDLRPLAGGIDGVHNKHANRSAYSGRVEYATSFSLTNGLSCE